MDGKSLETSTISRIEGHPTALKVSTLAAFLNVTPKSLYGRIKSGTLPAMRLGSSIRLDPATTAAWLRARSA